MESYDLSRFRTAQEREFELALSEVRRGKKESHWMWYIFPQLKGLAHYPSYNSNLYSIRDFGEAQAYMADPYLRGNLISITQAVLALEGIGPWAVFGQIDTIKLCSSMTLFEAAAPDVPEFGLVLDKYYRGQRDRRTLELLTAGGEN